MVKQRIDSVISKRAKYQGINPDQRNIAPFETKEEFITHLIRCGEIAKDTHHQQDDGFICLKGVLKIDDRVQSGLNWNDVIVTSAVVEQGKISRYQYLPKTYKGIKTNLKAPTVASYMLHNNYGADYRDNKWYVEILRIPDSASHLDFSAVNAKLTLFYGCQIRLSQLPYSKNILGLSPYSLGIDCPNARKMAQQKGCGKEILKILPSSNPFAGFIANLSSIFGSGCRR